MSEHTSIRQARLRALLIRSELLYSVRGLMVAGDETSPFAERAADPLSGTPYRTRKALGVGGMGEVVEAEHLELGKRVVVKLLHKSLAADPAMVDRFRFEAQVLARLSHPNLVAVTDLGTCLGGRPYFVMERLTGRTLAEELRSRGTLPVPAAIEIVQQVLAGLGEAHRYNVIHRDVKLTNIFLCGGPSLDGRRSRKARYHIKLLDFGIAKAGVGGDGTLLAPAPAYPTQERTVTGTPRYLAPEQIRGAPVDHRADIYAVGVVLYALVTGREPFAYPSAEEVMKAQLHEAPTAPSRVAPPVPPELDRAILRALAKQPEERFASADDFSDELEAVVARLGGTAPHEQATAASPPPEPRPSPANDAVGSTERGTVRMPLPSVPEVHGPPHAAPASSGPSSAGRAPVTEAAEAVDAPRGLPHARPSLVVLCGAFLGSAVCFWLLIMLAIRFVK